MMSPTAPLANRQLIWHLYSAQAYGIFHGDLDMYFGYGIRRSTNENEQKADTRAVCLDLTADSKRFVENETRMRGNHD
jgi:hypothetical protein